MKTTSLSLNGEWRCVCTKESGETLTFPGTVPGCLHTDLQRAGHLPADLYWRDNAEQSLWVEACDCVYSREFEVPALHRNAVLVFEGLDVYAEVVLNGVSLGRADNMFIPWRFPVDGTLREGRNTLEVRFSSPVRAVAGKPARTAAFTHERLWTRRIQCTYGWDWVTRFVTMGVWRDVSIVFEEPDALADAYVFTNDVEGDGGTAQVAVRSRFVRITGEGWMSLRVLAPDGSVVREKRRKILAQKNGASEVTLEEFVDVPRARLWYPAGYGEQPLYRLEISAPGSPDYACPFGIRKVVVREVPDAPGSPERAKCEEYVKTPHIAENDRNGDDTASFLLLVNGKRIFCRGGNWVPCEPFPSAIDPEKERRLVRVARGGGGNMLRVWGGGVFASEAFMDECDRQGILVTQDFLMACGNYPEEFDGFIAQLSLEARAAALALRNHPALVWWTGDNENAEHGDENMAYYTGRRAALEGIAPVLRALDPARRFLPSSPYGGAPYRNLLRGTSHNTNYIGDMFAWVREGDFTGWRAYFERFIARFCAEQGTLGMPFVSTLRRFMTEEDIFGPDESVSEFHTQSNPWFDNEIGLSIYGHIRKMTEGMFGTFKDAADRIRKTQTLQCEWVRLSMELYRRNAWFSSGMIYWMFNECWPAGAGWGLVDYDGAPQPSFYAFQRAVRPVIASVEEKNGGIRCVVSNLASAPARGRWRLYAYDIVDGTETAVAAGEGELAAPGEAATVWTGRADTLPVPVDARHVLLCDLECDASAPGAREAGTPSRDRAFLALRDWQEMAWPDYAEPLVAENSDGTVSVTARATTPVLLLDRPDLRLADDCMFLKKGETSVIRRNGPRPE